MQAVSCDEGSSFESMAISAAHDKFANLSYANLIELTMMNGDNLVKPEALEFGQVVDIISDGVKISKYSYWKGKRQKHEISIWHGAA